ncbi:MAG: histidinol dehydrogenase [Ignavibacteriae bacterium HGW-Ignavibacteriae-3]|nr:MAG: histidinol dehydrogenase [Ignavibacteriae bacterium HGW-Ignavibacteriae-3]
MKIYSSKNIARKKLDRLFSRPEINSEKFSKIVKPVVEDVKRGGLKSALKYARKFDQFTGQKILVSKKEIDLAENNIDRDTINAFKLAAKNIEKFHGEQNPLNYKIETMPGVICSREFRAIENVGLYVPGGTAVLPSTLLMLAIPARLAGCKRVVALSPTSKNIDPLVLYAAKICGVDEFYKIGGSQGIALMAYGDKSVKKVDKIFGPGNQFVTSAKNLVSTDPDGCAIDMPAGPSELLIIADDSASSSFIAADLLSQAEHGKDSQVILITTSAKLSKEVNRSIELQTKYLPRNDFIQGALKNSFTLIVNSIDEAVDMSNNYAPEHLILNIKNPERYKKRIINAGSVFLGKYSAESIGDYASGTNHSLPTYGYARTFGGISVESFMKTITFQEIRREGLKRIAPAVIKMAETEKLEAHANAVKVRLNYER